MSNDSSHSTGGHKVVLDETYLAQWFTLGLGEITLYLERQAAFEAYCETHPREEDTRDQ